eukprot:TRINITY_DN8900_c0_g1_i1.p1 TRINITY_DN8900_c0_g1~~TRINITY_DN8900_c0_g1_i1.p1  ORF type:complete len:536 (-),score=100.94 TRINITY_DN8900_c0_g1_i1:110-1717(-)
MSATTERLIQSLWDPSVQNDSLKLVEIIEPIPSLVSSGDVDCEALISPMIRLLGSHNADVKEHVCAFFLKLPSSIVGDVGVLAQNILIQDTQDPNPRIRSVAVSTLCSLPSGNADNTLPAVQRCLRDSNPLVRKAAVTGSGKFYLQHPTHLRDSGLIDNLYSIIKDPDPSVLTFALQTLNIILKDEGGIVIPRSMGQYLLGRLQDFPELEFCFVTDYLLKYYSPKKEEEFRFLMNNLDPFLDSKNGALFLSSARLFLKAIYDSDMRKNFNTRICSQLSRFLRKSSIALEIMEFIALLEDLGEPEAASISKELRFKSKDTPEILVTKVRLLSDKIRSSVSKELKVEIDAYLLKFCLTSGNPDVERELIRSLMNTPRPELVQKLEECLSSGTFNLFSPICELIRDIVRVNGPIASILTQTCLLSKDVKTLSSKELMNLIWILGNHSRIMSKAPYILEMLWAQRESELRQHNLLSHFLFAAIKVFLYHPLSTQLSLGLILEKVHGIDPDLTIKVEFYLRILQQPSLMNKLTLNDKDPA